MKHTKKVLALLLAAMMLLLSACTEKSTAENTASETESTQKVVATEDKAAAIVDEINQTYQSYINGDIDYSTAMATVQRLSAQSDSSKVISAGIDAENKIEALKKSIESYSEGKVLEEGGFYGEAIPKYEAVIEDDPNYADAQTRITTCIDTIKTTATQSADQSIKDKDYKAAIDTLNEAISILADDADLKSKLENTELLYVADTKQKVSDYLKKSKGKAAVDLINEFETVMEITEDMDIMLPTSTKDLNIINKSNSFGYKTDGTDTFGNNYNGNIIFWLWKDCYVEYNVIDADYLYLTFSLSPYKHYDAKRKSIIKVYSDNEIIWASDTITRKSEPVDVCISLPKNCKYIKFVSTSDDLYNSDIMVIDPYVWK